MIKNKKIKILTISILCILTLAIGLSYGYYLLNRVQENVNIAGSQCFNLEFTNEKNAINLDNMYPISDEEGKKLTPYSFTITNTCDMLAGYTVNMEMLEGTTLNSKYLDVMVNNEEIKLLTNYESTDTVIEGSTESRILAKGTLAYNDSVDYTVRFWMDKDVEDVDSMNKYFASKIVVVATPSSWNPKDAGYDTLHDAILANEYQTTPKDALKKIEAKGEPDLSQTAPIVKWTEKENKVVNNKILKLTEENIGIDNQTSDMKSSDSLLSIYSTVNFNSETGRYSLTNGQKVDPTTLDYENNNYYFITEGIDYDKVKQKLYVGVRASDIVVNKIISVSKETTSCSYNDINYECYSYNITSLSYGVTDLESDSTDKGIYSSIDDYGTTYYYRGNIKNNNVYFAGFYWQIVRINGDGSIRILYNGKKPNASGTQQSVSMSLFNSNNNDPRYSGYMYDLNNSEKNNANTTDSDIKKAVDEWYKTNMYDNGYQKYISDSGFCNDRSLYYGDGISKNLVTYYGAYGRTYDKNNPDNYSYKCPNISDDLFTTSDSLIGNKSLIYPVGLITYDELVYAGLRHTLLNKFSWAYSNISYWTMTPDNYYNGYENVRNWFSHPSGYLYNWWSVANNMAVRPVINLKSDVKITGGIGTTNDPFVIDTNE